MLPDLLSEEINYNNNWWPVQSHHYSLFCWVRDMVMKPKVRGLTKLPTTWRVHKLTESDPKMDWVDFCMLPFLFITCILFIFLTVSYMCAMYLILTTSRAPLPPYSTAPNKPPSHIHSLLSLISATCWMYGSLNKTSPHRPIGSASLRRCGLVGGSMLEECFP